MNLFTGASSYDGSSCRLNIFKHISQLTLTFVVSRHVPIQFGQPPKTLFTCNATKICLVGHIDVPFQSSARAEMVIAVMAVYSATVLLVLVSSFFSLRKIFRIFENKKQMVTANRNQYKKYQNHWDQSKGFLPDSMFLR